MQMTNSQEDLEMGISIIDSTSLICAGEEMLMRTTPQILNATKNLFAVMSVDVLGTMPPKDISM